MAYIPELVAELRNQGLQVDILDLEASLFVDEHGQTKTPPGVVSRLLARIPKVKRLARSFRYSRMISKLGDYDVANIHYASRFYSDVAGALRKRAKSLVVTIWGSDFLRIADADRLRLGRLFSFSNLVTFNNPDIRARFEAFYGSGKYPTRILRFGLKSLDIIDRIASGEDRDSCKSRFGIAPGKITVACGYNASKAQQHVKMLKDLSRLPARAKEKIHLILQLSYGGDADYVGEVKVAAAEAGLDFTAIEKIMTLEDVCRLRIASDIAVNIQSTDSFSASIQEHCYCGSRMIVGKWLPYALLEDMGYRFDKVRGDGDIAPALERIIDGRVARPENLEQCKKSLHELSSWSVLAPEWVTTLANSIESTKNPEKE